MQAHQRDRCGQSLYHYCQGGSFVNHFIHCCHQKIIETENERFSRFGTDIGLLSGRAISDFMFIRGSERNLLALPYNVHGLC